LRFAMRTTSLLISEPKVSSVLADEGERPAYAGTLTSGIHLPGEWLSLLVAFIGNALPGWRDDPARPAQAGETRLTAQLCARLNSLSRHTVGWDFLQFRREEPDEADARRSIDLAVTPSGSIIWIEGREYTEYRTLMPIECKRLPTPAGTDRDEREYLFSRFSSTGGVQRFKAGHHGATHIRAAIIGYLQDRNIAFWREQLDAWIDGLVGEAVSGWTDADKLLLVRQDATLRLALLQSNNPRRSGLDNILIDHLWIEMQ
jgi:hypothetical protein